MNERIGRLTGGLLALFAVLVGMTSYWQVVEAGSLSDRQDNRQTAHYEQRVERGRIIAQGGAVLAASRPEKTVTGDEIFRRGYPLRGLAAHLVGYNTVGKSRTGLERTYNQYLTGSYRDLAGLVDRLRGRQRVTGATLRLTLDPKAQRIAEQQLQGRRGAVVAIEPQTGKLLVMASAPDFDPRVIEEQFDTIGSDPAGPLINRATQGLYPPGSIFKIVTAAAALEQEVATPQSRFSGGCKTEDAVGPPIANFGGRCFAPHDLTYALTNSVNTTFAQLGEQVGSDKLREQMRQFGFESLPPLEDLPSGERAASGLYQEDRRELLDADAGIDVARLAIGQERLLVTPLQMALVTAAIANDGRLMKPYAVDRIADADGRLVRRNEPSSYAEVLSPATADTLSEMMTDVVSSGTGVGAALSGIDVAGKTGTADTPTGNQIWFVAFAPVENPKIAIAVTMESQSSGITGGGVAAPIARAVMEQVLG